MHVLGICVVLGASLGRDGLADIGVRADWSMGVTAFSSWLLQMA